MTRRLDGPEAEAAARAALAVLGDVVGAGLAAARRQPQLLSLLDQHAAAVRDSLRGDRIAMSPVALARYAQGVRDGARQYGWQPPDGRADWTTSDWVRTRLLAVHALAQGGWPALG